MDIGKFEQWKFKIQQYLQNEHYALWETFNRLQAIVSQLEFIEVETEQDDLNQKLLTSLALEWLMHTNVWRNRSDLDTMSLDDLYNHLKVYEPEVQKKSDSQNMAFISSSKNSSGNEEDNTASSNGSQVKYEDINQIDEDDIEEMDIKWNMALLSMRVDRYWKKTGKKISIQGTDVAGFDKSKVECFNCHKMDHFARECRAPMSQDRGRRDNYRQGSKLEEQAPKALMEIDRVGWNWSYMVADEEAPTEFALMAKTKTLKKEKEGLESKITGFKSDSKDLDKLLESQRFDKNKEGLGYCVVPPPPAQVYSPPKKDMSWTGLFEFADGTITDYTRPSPSVENSLTVVKTDKKETVRKPTVKYAELYRKTPKRSNVRDHGRSWAKNNNTYKSRTPKTVFHKTGRPPMRTNRPYMNATQPKRTSFFKPAHLYLNKPFQRTSAVRSQFRGLRVPTVNRTFPTVNRKFPTGNSRFSTADMGNEGKAIKASAYWIWKPTQNLSNKGNSQINIDDKGYWDSGCSRHMTGNISHLSDYKPYDGGYVSFGQGGCKITGKGTIKTGKHEFENVYFVKDLKYNLFSVSQICDNKNSVLFTDTECIVLGQNFKLTDDANVLLRTPRQHNMYSINLNNVFPHKNLTCLVAKASTNKCMLWHSRLGHLNIKIMNRLVRHNLVRGLPSKCFENDHTCVACLKGKQHNASLTDEFSRFTWSFFLKTKDETSGILRNFITEIENLKELRVKIIRCDNRGEFRNKKMNDFCSRKGIKREYSNARTPQQNGVAERRNKTLIEATRTITPAIGFLKPFGCHVMILNTLDNLGKFEAKRDEGYFIRYSMSSKAFRVFNTRTKRVEENLHVDFLENKLIEKGVGPNWLFDIDSLTNSMNYVPVVVAGINFTNFSGTKEAAGQDVKKDVSSLRYIILPNWFHEAHLETSTSNAQDACNADALESSRNSNLTATSTNLAADHMETLAVKTSIPTVSSLVLTACLNDSLEPSSDTRLISKRVTNQDDTPSLDNILTLTNRFEDILGVTTNTDDTNGVEADLGNIEDNISPSPTPTLRIHKDHPKSQIIGPVDTPVQTRTKSKEMEEQSFIATIHQMRNLALLQFCLFSFYQVHVKSAFLYGTIDEEVYVMQPLGFQDPEFPARVYKVEKAMYGLHQAPRAWYVLQKEDGIFLSQDQYVGDILKKFRYSDVRSSNTPMYKENPWGKDETRKDADLHLYRSMIGSLMYLTASRPDIMFAVYAYARHQVTPKGCHLHIVKRIFRYLNGHPKLGIWYPKESPFDRVAYSDSDYGGATQDRKSTTGGCQFLGRRLISWQFKNHIIVATSTTEAEYVAAASGCGQALWIQNQLLDYG
nr:hypothetical protein [Tanacetum cinerariifolium]